MGFLKVVCRSYLHDRERFSVVGLGDGGGQSAHGVVSQGASRFKQNWGAGVAKLARFCWYFDTSMGGMLFFIFFYK